MEKKLIKETLVSVDTAESGADALRLTGKKRYDVILMDHLMPGMDGVECLRRLRSQTEGMCGDVPVMILTANAGGENLELYEKAGFDGYLMKPVSGRSLEEALMKHLPKDKMIISGTEEADTVSMTPQKDITAAEEGADKAHWYEKIDGIDGGIGIENCGDEEGFRYVLEIFYRDISEKSQELETLLSSGDIGNYTVKVHALKSSAKIIGAMEHAEGAFGLEKAGEAKDMEYIRAHHGKIMELYRSFLERLAPLYEEV